jgi:restriction endonuclease Mrr
VKSRDRYELEAMGCGALFVLGLLALVCWSLYQHGYLGIVAAVVGGVALFTGFMYAVRARAAPKPQANNRRYQEEAWEEHPSREQEERQPPEHEEWFVHSVTREGREEEERPIDALKEEEQPIEELSKRGAIVQHLDEISDEEFEQVVAYYLRTQGHVVETMLASGGRGANFIIAAAEYRISVLLKRQEELVGTRAVQEALGGRAFYGTYEAWLITNNAFTRGTLHEAKRKGVRLIDGDELAQWLVEKLPDLLEDEA